MTAWLLLLAGSWLLAGSSARYRLHPGPVRLRRPRRLMRTATPQSLVELVEALRDELAAGTALRPAFDRAVRSTGRPLVPQAVAVNRMGGDVPAALRADADGDGLLLSLAALWQASENSGAAMAAALDRLVDGAREGARVRREIAAQLAGPRATARVLALLPLVGLGMGFAMGADPIGFLLGTPYGWGCLAAAVAFEVAGVFWMRRLVHGIEKKL